MSIETPEVMDATAPTPAPETSAPAPETAAPAEISGEQPEVPAYTPNFKVKVMDRELEIPEKFRTIMKDANTEKEVREVFEKAYGLAHVKKKYKKTKEMYDEVHGKYTELEKDLKTASKYLNNKDFQGFFDMLGINEKDVFQYVNKRLQYQELTPEQRAEYDRQSNFQRQAITKESQLEELQAKVRQQEQNQLSWELDQRLKSPEVANYASQYEARLGEGSFKQAVATAAEAHFYRTGKDLTPDEAVKHYLQIVGYNPQAVAPAVSPTTTSAGKPPVIPNIAGKSGSPVAKAPKSFDDLRKQYAERVRKEA